MLDLVVTGGTAILPTGAQTADIGVAASKIAAIGAPGSLQSVDTARTVDAAGQIVMPGGIDPHIHCSMPIPFPGRNEDLLSAPPEQVSRAALHGGTTTLLDFVQCPPDQPLQRSIEARQREWAGACYCDYGLHLLLHGKLSQGVLGALPEAIQEGHASVKMFTTDIRPNRQGRMVQFGDIWEVLQILAAKGGIAAIHAEDNDIVMHMYEKLIREDRVGFENMAEVHNTLSEDLSFNRVIRLAENVAGAALYMVHVSAATGVAAIARSRAQGFPIYGETLHQYLLYTAEDYKRPGGQMYHTYPSLKFAKDQEALWAATGHGAIQAIATDEVCCPLQVKLQGRRIDDTTGGNSGVEPRLSLMYTHMVEKRGYSLADFVGLVSSNAARIMGLYPRKGALAVGSDADIVLLDPRARRVLHKEDLHETDYTPWEGHEVAVWPSMTILRGKVVVENGVFLASLNDGQFLPRKIGDDIRAPRALSAIGLGRPDWEDLVMVTAAIWPVLDYSRVPYRLYHDAELYAREQARIFCGPVWSFLGLAAEIPKPGDFRATYVGETPVIFNRDESGQVKAFVNRCAHRGALVRRESSGNAANHICIYHQWCYGLNGHLTAIPFRRGIRGKGGLDPSFDMGAHGLRPLRVGEVNGVLFGTLDEDAEPLEDYLGAPILEQLRRLFDRPVSVLGYNRQRIRGNWKLYAENTRDNYHASLLHEFLVTFGLDRSTQVGGVRMDARHRHNITWAEADSDDDELAQQAYAGAGVRSNFLSLQEPALVTFRPERTDRLNIAITSVFPSAVFVQISNSLAVRQIRPRGVDEVEVFQTMLGYADDTSEMTLHRLRQANLVGPAGLVSMEDGEAIELAHRASKPDPGRTTIIELGGAGVISDRDYRVTDVPLRGFWSYYAELLGIEPEGAVR